MDLDKGLVSPQFHVMFDNEFQTVRQYKSTPLWKVKTGLISENRSWSDLKGKRIKCQ